MPTSSIISLLKDFVAFWATIAIKMRTAKWFGFENDFWRNKNNNNSDKTYL